MKMKSDQATGASAPQANPRVSSLRTGTRNLFGDYIRKARLNAGMTQGQLAHILGVKQSHVSAWERGTFYPRVARGGNVAIEGNSGRLRDALGCNPKEFSDTLARSKALGDPSARKPLRSQQQTV